MISSEVEDRIARYFFHQYLPEDVRLEIDIIDSQLEK